jgi:lipid A 3-O-deacylase
VKAVTLKISPKNVTQCVLIVLMMWFFLVAHVHAGDRPLLGMGAGVLGIVDNDKVGFASIEYRPAIEFYKVSPWLGLEFSDRFFFGAAGLLMNFLLTDELRFTPSFGLGYYPDNSYVDLGGDFQISSAFELSYRFNESGRLGIAWSHISNGKIYGKNPGTEILKITYYIPLCRGD